MNTPKRKMIYNNTEYEVCEWVIDEVEKAGLTFDSEYIADLLQNESPYYPWGLTILAHNDTLNRRYIGSNGLLGRIVKVNKNGIVLDYYESVFDACMDGLSGNYKYSFEKLHNSGIVSSKVSCDFFGVTINLNPSEKECKILSELNRIIRRNTNRYLGKRKIVREMYTDEVASRMSYEEYIIRGMRWEAFSFGHIIHNLLGIPQESQYTKHDVEKCGDYSERMDMLLQKYSVKGQTAFEFVQDLNDFKNCVGIYLLCIPQIKGCYVGKTQKCFATRIAQHFTTPNSAFDKKYKPGDIKEIYVLQLDETMQLIDSVEEDCIATLGKEICLNALAGGNGIDLIKSERYDPSEHLLDSKLIRWVAEDALNILCYRKECAMDIEQK